MSDSSTLGLAYRLYKGNSPFEGQQFFADYLNHSLRDGTTLNPQWTAAASELDSLIAVAPLRAHMTLYRASIDPFVMPYITDSVLTYPAYMSTSSTQEGLQRHFASAFRGLSAALLTIDCEPGTHALDMEGETAFGGDEHEFLLPRGARFQVESVREEIDRQVMENIMSLYAANYSSLKLYKLHYLGRADQSE